MDADFADDITLLSNTMNEAQVLLNAVESATQSVGLVINAGKMKFMCYEQDSQIQSLKHLEGKNLECVTIFEYLSLWISTTSRDIASCKAKAWLALHKLGNIWKSNLPKWLKMQFFRVVTESILLYGTESWTLMKAHESQLDGTYTWMPCFALNVHWNQHVANKQLYGHLPHLGAKIRLHHINLGVTAVKQRRNQYSKFSSGCHSMAEEGMVGPP